MARIFCVIDRNNDRTVSSRELKAWLSTGSKGKDDGKAAEAIEWVQQKFENENIQHHRIRVTLEDFWTLMYDGGIIEKLKQADLWKRLALKHVFDEKALGQMFDHVVSEFGNEGDEYIDTQQLSWCFVHMGMVAPPPAQLAKQMRMFDRTVRGKLSRTQFIELMVDHIRSRQGKMEFTAGLWCPMEIFGMTLDLIPWGEQKTTIVEDECITRGRAGPFASSDTGRINKACKKHFRVEFSLSKSFMTSWEMSKARWLHAEGNPLKLPKLAGYLAEALLLYAIIASDYVQGEIVSMKHNILGPLCCGFFCCACFTLIGFHHSVEFYINMIPGQQRFLVVNWSVFVAGFMWVYDDSERAFGGAFGPYSAHYIVRIAAIQWWGLRLFLLMFRKIGTANMFVIGQPLKKQKSRSRQCFPVDIENLQDICDAFLQVKKFSAMDTEQAYREAIPGYGFIPHDLDRCQCCESCCSGFTRWWRRKVCSEQGCPRNWITRPFQSCRGLHSMYIGKQHFEIERNNGGGWKSASHRTAGWRTRVTRMDHVIGFMEDIRWVLVQKNGIALSDLIRDTVKAMIVVFVLVVPLALLASYPCSDVLNLRGRDKPSSSALERNPNSVSWAKWSTFNSTATQMSHFDGAQEWCDAFDTSEWWFVEIEESSRKTRRPCVCPLQPGEICNPNLDPSLYFRSWGQPNWCSNWEQGTQFYTTDDQTPRAPSDTLLGISLLEDPGWPWPPPGPPGYLMRDDDDWEDGHFNHDPSLKKPVWSTGTDDVEAEIQSQTTAMTNFGGSDSDQEIKVLETEREYRSRDQPCECLTPMSTALPSLYIAKAIFTYFLLLIEPLIVLNWLRYRPWHCKLGVAGLGNFADCAVRPSCAMDRLFRRRHAVELSQNIQRLNQVLVKSKIDAGSLITHGLDDSTLIIYDLPEVLFEDDKSIRRNLKLDALFKRGHRAEFLAATLFEQVGTEPGSGKAGGWGAVVTVRDQGWIDSVVYQQFIDVEHDPLTGPMIVLKRTETKFVNRKHYYLTVSAFPKVGDELADHKKDKLREVIKDVQIVLDVHNTRAAHAYVKLHASENQHASFYRHMSANDQAASLFRAIDYDSNGFVNKDELARLIEREKESRVNVLYDLLTFVPDDEEKYVEANAWPDVLQKQASDITVDDYTKVFGFKPEPDAENMGQDVLDELQVRHLLSQSGEMAKEAMLKERVFSRLPNGKLRESVARRLDFTKLKKKVDEDATVRPDDMRALEEECKAAARIAIAARLSVLDDSKKKELDQLADAKKLVERKKKRAKEAREAQATSAIALSEGSSGVQNGEQEDPWDIGSKQAVQELEEQVKADQELEEFEDMEEEHAKQLEQMAETTGNEEDKWALLRVRLERDVSRIEIVQGLVDLITLPGWLEHGLELILQRMDKRDPKAELIEVGRESELSIEEQLVRAKARLKAMAHGGIEAVGGTGSNGCCSAGDDTVDQDTLDMSVALGQANVHHLEALQHKTVLAQQQSQMDSATQSIEQAQRFNSDDKLINAELLRSDPVKAREAFASGQRVIRGQFRRWFVEYLGGVEHFEYDLSDAREDVINAASRVQRLYGTLMTRPDSPELLNIDFGRLAHKRVNEAIRCVHCILTSTRTLCAALW